MGLIVLGDELPNATGFTVTAGTSSNFENVIDRRLGVAATFTPNGSGVFAVSIDVGSGADWISFIDVRRPAGAAGLGMAGCIVDVWDSSPTIVASATLNGAFSVVGTKSRPRSWHSSLGGPQPIARIDLTFSGLTVGATYSIGRIFLGTSRPVDIADGWTLAVRERATIQRNRGAQSTCRESRRFREIAGFIIGQTWATVAGAGYGVSLQTMLANSGASTDAILMLRPNNGDGSIDRLSVCGVLANAGTIRTLADANVSIPFRITEGL